MRLFTMNVKLQKFIFFTLSALYACNLQAQNDPEPGYKKLISKLKDQRQERVTTRTTSERLESKTLLQAHHLPRTGDRFVRLKASHLSPGKPGEDVIWDFNHLQLNGEEQETDYMITPASLLTGIDNETMQSYLVSGDTLQIYRYENSLALVYLEKPEEVMVFPMSCGDERTAFFYGKGKYCDRLELDVTGFTYSLADGYGTLILPQHDTVYDALRVYTAKITLTDSRPATLGFDIRTPRETPLSYKDILARLERDTTFTFTETYRWYARGSRYPVLETGSSQIVMNDIPVSTVKNTFVYHPEDQQIDFPSDSVNRTVPKEKTATGADEIQINGEGLYATSSYLNINTYPNPVTDRLLIDIKTDQTEKGTVFGCVSKSML